MAAERWLYKNTDETTATSEVRKHQGMHGASAKRAKPQIHHWRLLVKMQCLKVCKRSGQSHAETWKNPELLATAIHPNSELMWEAHEQQLTFVASHNSEYFKVGFVPQLALLPRTYAYERVWREHRERAVLR